MTNEQIDEAISRAMNMGQVWIDYGGGPGSSHYLEWPNFSGDLNMMHKAWEYLKTTGEDEAFCRQLRLIACPHKCESSECSYTINATATQRAEAFLRTIGKWTE